MYSSTLLTTLLATAVIAVPNMLPRLPFIQPVPGSRDDIAYASAGYDQTPESTSTTLPTLATTVSSFNASLTWSASIATATETVVLTATRTRARIWSSVEAGTQRSISSSTSSHAVISSVTMISASAMGSSATSSFTSTETPTNVAEPSTLAGVYICSDINWSGNCKHYLTPIGSSPSACTLLDGTASSIGPDMGFSCNFYTNSYCDSIFNDRHDVIALAYPGTADLRRLPQGDYNDDFYSYQCFENA